MHGQNWDDLRFVLAVAEEGSVSAAARILRVNHATVLRRIAAYEDRIGMQIFDRTAQGYVVPTDHSRVIDALREVMEAVTTVDRIAQGVESKLSGGVRITSTDTFCQTVLPGVVAALEKAGEGLRIEVFCTNAHLDLARLEADIAIRPAIRLPEALVGDKAGVLGVAPYGPATGPAPGWLALRGPLERSRPSELLDRARLPMTGAGADSFVVLREMVAQGLGNALLPCVVAGQNPRLARIDRDDLVTGVPIWVASHADLGNTARLRDIRGRIVEALLARGQELAGPVSPG